jgi:hypothetical protein
LIQPSLLEAIIHLDEGKLKKDRKKKYIYLMDLRVRELAKVHFKVSPSFLYIIAATAV